MKLSNGQNSNVVKSSKLVEIIHKANIHTYNKVAFSKAMFWFVTRHQIMSVKIST